MFRGRFDTALHMQKWQHLEKVHKKDIVNFFSHNQSHSEWKNIPKSCVANYLCDQDIVDRSNPAPAVTHETLWTMGDSPYQLQDSWTINSITKCFFRPRPEASVVRPVKQYEGLIVFFFGCNLRLKNSGNDITTEVFQTTYLVCIGCVLFGSVPRELNHLLLKWCLNLHQLTSFNNYSLKFKTVLALQTKFCWTSSIGTHKLMSSTPA